MLDATAEKKLAETEYKATSAVAYGHSAKLDAEADQPSPPKEDKEHGTEATEEAGFKSHPELDSNQLNGADDNLPAKPENLSDDQIRDLAEDSTLDPQLRQQLQQKLEQTKKQTHAARAQHSHSPKPY